MEIFFNKDFSGILSGSMGISASPTPNEQVK